MVNSENTMNIMKRNMGKIIWKFVSVLLITGSGWWFDYVVEFFGKSLHLTENGDLTTFGQLLTPTVMLFAVIFAFAQEVSEYIIRNKKENEIHDLNEKLSKEKEYQRFLNEKESELYQYRISNKIPILKDGAENTVKLFDHTEEQLKRIQEAMQSCVKKNLDIYYGEKERKVYVSVLYSFPGDNDKGWKWTSNSNQRGASAEKLINGKSVFRKLLDQDEPYAIFNSKNEAHKAGWYEIDGDDKKENMNGSIICYKISLKENDDDYLIALIGISTYQNSFFDENLGIDAEEVALRLLNDVVDVFSQHLKLELCNLRIKEIHQKGMKEYCTKN